MSSVVYFVSVGDHIKIGFTSNLKARLQAIGCGTPKELTLIATVPGGRALEMAVHSRLAAHRVKGEWFADCTEVRSEIERLGACVANGDEAKSPEPPARPEPTAPPPAAPFTQTSLDTLSSIQARFKALIDADVIKRFIEVRRCEIDQGLPRGKLAATVLGGKGRSAKFRQAFDSLCTSHDKFGRLLNEAHLRVFDDRPLDDIEAAAHDLVAGVESAFAAFTSRAGHAQ